ncbi:hypothetical protein DESC_100044 [Desulfosarcina cetonica]|nr:hypothetical protein DESC_100044 [Desulfosarcina cetonica]
MRHTAGHGAKHFHLLGVFQLGGQFFLLGLGLDAFLDFNLQFLVDLQQLIRTRRHDGFDLTIFLNESVLGKLPFPNFLFQLVDQVDILILSNQECVNFAVEPLGRHQHERTKNDHKGTHGGVQTITDTEKNDDYRNQRWDPKGIKDAHDGREDTDRTGHHPAQNQDNEHLVDDG